MLQNIIGKFFCLFFCFRVFINLLYSPLRTRLEAVLDKYMENEAEIFIFPQIHRVTGGDESRSLKRLARTLA